MMPQILQSWAILLIVALGGLLSERGGILNIGLEGMITAGAFAASSSSRVAGGRERQLVLRRLRTASRPSSSIQRATSAGSTPSSRRSWKWYSIACPSSQRRALRTVSQLLMP